MNHRELTRRLRRLGCQFVRQAPGSHEIWWISANQPFTVMPRHGGRDLPKGTRRAILRQPDIDPAVFYRRREDTDLTMHHLAIPLGLTGTYPRAGLRLSRTAPNVILILIPSSISQDMNEAIASDPGIAERQQTIYTSLRVTESSPVASE